jgi:hypothetical protein
LDRCLYFQPHELADWRDLRQAVDRSRRLHAMTVKGIIALEQARLLKANIASMEQVSAVLHQFASSSKQHNMNEVLTDFDDGLREMNEFQRSLARTQQRMDMRTMAQARVDEKVASLGTMLSPQEIADLEADFDGEAEGEGEEEEEEEEEEEDETRPLAPPQPRAPVLAS